MTEGIDIRHGDCLDILPGIGSGDVGLVVTDPPYGVAYKTGRRKGTGHRFAHEMLNDRDLGVVEAVAPELWRVLRDDGAMFMFCAWRRQDEVAYIVTRAGFTVQNRIIWDKCNHTAGDLTHAFGYQYEVIVFATKGRPEIRGRRHKDVWRCPRVPSDRLVHQNQKPTALLEVAILSMSDPGDVVLDPFMGSGSTGVACMNTGRRFIGVELDDGYFEVARGRLGDESSQGRLFAIGA